MVGARVAKDRMLRGYNYVIAERRKVEAGRRRDPGLLQSPCNLVDVAVWSLDERRWLLQSDAATIPAGPMLSCCFVSSFKTFSKRRCQEKHVPAVLACVTTTSRM
jgi:hypothetical protein